MSDTAEVPEVDVYEAQRRVQGGSLLVDVREPDEFAERRIAKGQLLPLSELTARFEELPKDQELVVYCRSGRRSAQATGFLRAHGYNAVNVAGGILAWQEAALETQQG